MKVSPHFLRLYVKTVRRYRKLSRRLQNQLSKGEFQQKSDYAKGEFLYELRKLRKKIFGLRAQLRLALAAGVTAMALSSVSVNAQDINMGPFIRQSRGQNPFPEGFSFDWNTSPATADIDGDKDFDLFVGDYGSGVAFLRNVGTKSKPFFQQESFAFNPLSSFLNSSYENVLSFGDLDGDGDKDVLVGNSWGEIKYLQNTGATNTVTNEYGESFKIPVYIELPDWDSEFLTGNFFTNFSFDNETAPLIVDLDRDGDNDVFVGTYSYFNGGTVRYFSNNGDGTFAEESLSIGPFSGTVRLGTALLDADSDPDLIVGQNDGYGSGLMSAYTYEGISDGVHSFNQLVGGSNPFDAIDESVPSPAIVDLDNDSDFDLILGTKYGAPDLLYYKNDGNDNLEIQFGLDSPFKGIGVSGDAHPELTDVDGDGLIDLIIGSNSYTDGQAMKYYHNDGNGKFSDAAVNPFADFYGIQDLTPQLIDLNGDGFKDLVGTAYSQVKFFVNNGDGTYTEDISVFADIYFTWNGFQSSKFVDFDGDGDYDLFFSDYYYDSGSAMAPHTSANGYVVRYFENTGDAQTPVFEEHFGNTNPFYSYAGMFIADNRLFPAFYDLDNDGDLDAMVAEGGYPDYEHTNGTNQFQMFENWGVYLAPMYQDLIPQYTNAVNPSPVLYDWDQDGDIDVFEGDANGNIAYYKNENPAPVTGFDTTPFETTDLSGSVVLDPNATLNDIDDDYMSKIVVSINNFNQNDTLTFTHPMLDESSPSAVFDDVNGILTITGQNSSTYFERILQSLTYSFDESGAPSSSAPPKPGAPSTNSTPSLLAVNKSIRIQVFDTDLTAPIARTKPIAIGIVNEPTINNATVNLVAGKSTTLNLKPLISDEQDLDTDLTLAVTQAPANATSATIDVATQILTIDYTGKSFKGIETMKVRVTDTDGNTDTNTITIHVNNTSPVFNTGSGSVFAGGTASVDLSTLYSDVDDNLVLSTLAVTAQPGSGAIASIIGTDLTIDYAGNSFVGNDVATVHVCDITGTCASANITIAVTNTAPSFSAGNGNVVAGGTTTVDASTLYSDAENNIVASSLTVTAQPASGATTSISGNIVTIDYTGISFSGSDLLTLQICDVAGQCALSDVTIAVTNTAPVVSSGTASAVAGSSAMVNLLPLVSDADNNLVLSTLKVVGNSTSGVAPTIDASNRLVVDYGGFTFAGNDIYTIEVCDIAGACDQNNVTIDVTNNAPDFVSNAQTVGFAGKASISLTPLLSDPDDNLNLTTLQITQQPASGAPASIDANNNLVVDYTGRTFSGTDNVTVRVCDFGASCAQAVFAITVSNSAPIITTETITPAPGLTKHINLLDITSDPDNNLDESTFAIVSVESGATAQIVNGELVVDYKGVSFSGVDHITVRVCDQAGACTEQVIAIEVESGFSANNAVAPHGSSEANTYLKLNGMSPENHVSIYNRWGDLVYEAFNYDNVNVRFEGRNNNGNDLASGTYFYKAEFTVTSGGQTSQETKTGYLALKQ